MNVIEFKKWLNQEIERTEEASNKTNDLNLIGRKYALYDVRDQVKFLNINPKRFNRFIELSTYVIFGTVVLTTLVSVVMGLIWLGKIIFND